MLLSGCAPAAPDSTRNLTWEDAKSDAQAMERELAALIPPDVVVSIRQKPTGTLFSCDGVGYRWLGSTTVTVISGTTIESIVRDIEAQYQHSRFTTSTRMTLAGFFELDLRSPATTESYLIGENVEGSIWIDSSSACFTLPEGVYPGGDF
ncbi:MAG: hypothetical protein J7484_07475 [Microbacterium sp.]|nr:hypothetical protein [Microbacterium sp.]